MRLAVIVALLCVAGWTGAVQAQDQAGTATPSIQGQAQPGTGEGATRQQPLIMSPNEQLIEGQVLEDKTVDVKDGKSHRVVHLKLRDGRTQQVDLGPKETLPSGFDIRKGQWVLVAGIQGRMGDQPVFVAHRWANVFNLPAGGGTPSAPTERLPGQREGEGGSKANDSDYKAQYRDYKEGDHGRAGDQDKSD